MVEAKRRRLALGRHDIRDIGEVLRGIGGRAGPGVQRNVEEHRSDQ